MKHLPKENAVPTAIGNGVQKKVIAPLSYITTSDPATDFAHAYVARRYRMPITTARLICELAQIGGSNRG